ncbi:MAG: prepilin-type N-terminal cleavage/methylation domain-containing protein [Armatimonadetes bacterium]|nr:prepilin-type N-terminal cleavage/methylation domain-containing protein [Armatimonadota bacterium]
MNARKTERGFTLVEIMVVVFILAILLSIAFPSWVNARTRSAAKNCQRNLSKVYHAKEQFAMDSQRNNGDPCTVNDLVPTYLKGALTCPSGGTYTVGTIGTVPTCSHGGDHIAP